MGINSLFMAIILNCFMRYLIIILFTSSICRGGGTISGDGSYPQPASSGQ